MGRKLNDAQIAEINELREAGVSVAKIAAQFGVARSTVWELVSEKGQITAMKRIPDFLDDEAAEKLRSQRREAARKHRKMQQLLK